MQTFDDLNAAFAIPGILSFDDTTGLTRASITTPACTAELYLHGAHITAWQPVGCEPVLFLSEKSLFAPDKAIRGGVPIIFPWFGSRTATPESARTDGPSHGFARIQPWQLDFAAVAGDDLHLSLTLEPTELSRSLGFDHFLLAYQITVGRELRLRLSIANNGDTPLHLEEALHSYFHVGDVEQARVHGLANIEYLDKTDNLVRKRQAEPVLMLTGPTDRPYLNTTAPVAVEDPILHRRITVTKSNSNTTVVWNPWAYSGLSDMTPDGWRQMICIESANAADNALTLHPQEAHTMETTLSVEALA
jgi:glucose-6-phosphate 1-epimerase